MRKVTVYKIVLVILSMKSLGSEEGLGLYDVF